MTQQRTLLAIMAVAAVTTASIWISAAIPLHQHRVAKAQVTKGLSVARNLETRLMTTLRPNGTCAAPTDPPVHSHYLSRATVDPKTCALTVTFRDTKPVVSALQGVTLTLQPKGTTHGAGMDSAESVTTKAAGGATAFECLARGGQGMSQADFPPECKYHEQNWLL